jgi:hypothetical protein
MINMESKMENLDFVNDFINIHVCTRDGEVLDTICLHEKEAKNYINGNMIMSSWVKDEIISAIKILLARNVECKTCLEIAGGFGPSHNGSPNCESGSIASGGNRSHCSCDTCF